MRGALGEALHILKVMAALSGEQSCQDSPRAKGRAADKRLAEARGSLAGIISSPSAFLAEINLDSLEAGVARLFAA